MKLILGYAHTDDKYLITFLYSVYGSNDVKRLSIIMNYKEMLDLAEKLYKAETHVERTSIMNSCNIMGEYVSHSMLQMYKIREVSLRK